MDFSPGFSVIRSSLRSSVIMFSLGFSVINLMENKGLTKKSGALPNITIYYDIKNG